MNIKRPVMWMMVAFVLGEVAAYQMGMTVWFIIAAAFFLLAVIKTAEGRVDSDFQTDAERVWNWKDPMMCRVFLLFFCFLAGWGRMMVEMRPDALERMVTQKGGSAEVAVSGTLDSISEKNGWCTMILTGVEVEDESVRKVLISCKSDLLEKCEEKILPPCGSQIHLTGNAEFLEEARNPGQFSYRMYYRGLGIRNRVTADRIFISEGKSSPLRSQAECFRAYATAVFQEICVPEEAGIFQAILESENIFVMDEDRAMSQDIRPLEILILNLMPIKEDTETQLLRALSNTPLQVDCSFLMLETHVSKNTSQTHLNKFYVTFDEIRRKRFDGMIITGAPVENMEFEEINYWDELTKIMEWSKTHVTSTFHICWGMQAGLYYHYGIQKHQRKTKLSGIYRHRLLNRKIPLVRSLDDYFYCPHSRYTEDREEDILKHPELQILAKSDEAGVFLVMNQDGSQIFVQGHPEYDRMTLNNEYHRDLKKGLNPQVPCNYYPDNDPFSMPVLKWRNMSNTLYTNWLNYYVYQMTPYVLKEDEQE